MLGLWWFLFVVDWAYLVFRYFYEIRTAKEEENTSNRVSTPDSKNNDFNNKNNVIDENEQLYRKAGEQKKEDEELNK